MSTTMDPIHHIRDLFYVQGKNISEIASETGFNWKTVKKYVDMDDFNNPPPTPKEKVVHVSKLDPYKPLIDSWLAADKTAPRKQIVTEVTWRAGCGVCPGKLYNR